MTLCFGYIINNTMIKLLIYFNLHMRFVEQIINIFILYYRNQARNN